MPVIKAILKKIFKLFEKKECFLRKIFSYPLRLAINLTRFDITHLQPKNTSSLHLNILLSLFLEIKRYV